jgi:hypothetical protein
MAVQPVMVVPVAAPVFVETKEPLEMLVPLGREAAEAAVEV